MLSFKDFSIFTSSTASTASFWSTEMYGPYLSCVFHLMRSPTNISQRLISHRSFLGVDLVINPNGGDVLLWVDTLGLP